MQSEPGETQVPDLTTIKEEERYHKKKEVNGLDMISDFDSAKNGVQEDDFEVCIFTAQKKLDNLERKHLLVEGDLDEAVQWHLGEHMTHSYYLDTLSEIRSFPRVMCDLFLVCFTMLFLFAAL